MSFDTLLHAWRRRPRREQALLAGVMLLLLAAAVDALWTAPLAKRLRQAERGLAALQQRLQADQAPAGAAQGSEQRHEQEAQLRQRMLAAQVASAQLRQRVAEATRLPETLRVLTTTVGSARLLELNLGGEAATPVGAGASAAGRLYRLPISLKVSGSYDELQRLLAQIERHAEALQWQTLALDGSQWPAIQLTLKAHVLSLEPRWGSL